MDTSPVQPTQFATSHQSILTAAKGSGITFLGTMGEYAGRLILGFLLARFMGAEQYGLYSLADSAVFMVIGIALMGMDTALMHFIPVFSRRREATALQATLQVGLGIPLALGILGGIGLFVFAGPIAQSVFHEPRLALLLRIVALAAPFGVMSSAAVGATRGFKQMQYKVITQDIALTLIKLILTAVLAITGLTAMKAMAAYSAAVVASCLLLIYFLNKLIPLNRPAGPWRRHLKQMLGFSLPVYVSRLLALFGPNLRIVLLGMFSTVFSVGIFTVATRIRMVSLAFQSAMVVMGSPIVSELHGQQEREKLERFYQTVTKWTLTFNLPLFLVIVCFPQFLLSIFGQDFTAGAVALVILACGDLVNAATGICGVMVTMTGNPWLNTVDSIFSLAVTLLFSLWLIPTMGVVGAGIAAMASVTFSNLFQLIAVFVLFRMLPYDRSFVKPVLAAGAAAVATWAAMRWLLTGSDWASVIVNMGILLSVYAVVILGLGLSEEDQFVLRHFYSRLNRVTRSGRGVP